MLTGHAAAGYAGPRRGDLLCNCGPQAVLFAGLCYSEYASMIPVAGSAYTYTYATMGRMMAWIIGWNLVLEYLAAASTVAVGGRDISTISSSRAGFPIPAAIASAPLAGHGFADMTTTGTIINLPAVALVGFITWVLITGVKTSANFNNVMVIIKLTIVLLVIFACFSHIVPANHTPFIPPNTGEVGHFGWTGVFRATGVIFFAYIGFDAVSMAQGMAKNPQRDVPLGMLGSLLICTVLYMLMSYVLTGIAPYQTLNVPHPVSEAVEHLPSTAWLAPFVSLGAIVGLASVVLVLLLAQSRVFYAMSRDGLVPKTFSDIHPASAPRPRATSSPASSPQFWRARCPSTSWANW